MFSQMALVGFEPPGFVAVGNDVLNKSRNKIQKKNIIWVFGHFFFSPPPQPLIQEYLMVRKLYEIALISSDIVRDEDYSASVKTPSPDSEGRLLSKAGCRHG